MTWGQWLFEYHALQKKEEDERQFEVEQMKWLQRIMISLLGTAVFGPKTPAEIEADKKAGRDPEVPNYVGLAWLLGNPEVMKQLALQADKKAAALERGDSFDELSENIAAALKGKKHKLPATMVPLLTENLATIHKPQRWDSPENMARLAAAGVRPRAPGMSAPVPHHTVTSKGPVPGVLTERDLAAYGELPGAMQTAPQISPAELEKFKKALGNG